MFVFVKSIQLFGLFSLLLLSGCGPVKKGQFSIIGDRLYKQDKTPPALVSLLPVHQEASAVVGSNLVITFDDKVRANSNLASTDTIFIRLVSDNSLFAAYSFNDSEVVVSGKTITINPSSDFDFNTSYYVEISANAVENLMSLGFAGISGNNTWQFNTEAAAAPALVIGVVSGATTEAGGTATFTVKLAVAPATDVVLDITSNDLGEGTVSPATLTFTSDNWNTNQTVTVTGVDDSIIDGNNSYNVTVAVDDGNSDDNYDGVVDSTVAITNNDNDIGSFVIGAVSGNTTEIGGTATFTVKLGAGPSSDVVLNITSTDLTEGTVSPATLTFTSANWNTNQTVTVTGVNDSIIDGSISYNVTVSVNDGSSNDSYDSVADSQVSVTNNDNDDASIIISAISGVTSESGTTATFTVKLGAGPASNVVLDILSTDTGEGTVSPATLTFTSANWNTNQTVTVTGVDDGIIDGNITYDVTVAVDDINSNDSYDAVADSLVSVTNNDNDVASLVVGAISGATTEAGGTATFTVKLGLAPATDVVLDITSADTGEGTVSPATLTFTSANWNTNQTVTVTGVDDFIIDGNISYNVTVAVDDGSSDDAYDGVPDSQVAVTNNDNEVASLVVSAMSGVTTEAGGTATFTVKLGAGVASDVVLSITSNDTGEGTVSPATLTFTSANWNTNQTVTVTGVDDDIIDGNITYNVTVSVTDGSSDDAYDAVADSQVSVTNNDNDTASLVVSAISGVTTEAGTIATFTVKLGKGPLSDVVLNITSTDTSEGTVSPSTLTFTSANWNTNQTVTVTGVDDDIIDGNITYNLTVSVTDGSSDDAYDGVADSQVAVTNNDNDAASAALVIGAISGATTEAGATATFTVKLAAGPLSDVVIDLSSADLSEGTVSPLTLTFTAANWNTNQTVTVTGVDDDIIDGNIAFDINLVIDDLSSADSYDGVVDGAINVTNDDNDLASFVIGAVSGATTEAGGTATFTVKLGAGPSSDVVLDITSQDTGEGTVSLATLTFTTANWNTNQTVTVTGVDDDIIDGNITYNVTVLVDDGSSHDSYDGVADSQVSVTNNDNDGASLVVSAISGNTSETGSTATFTVKLGKGPLSDVVLNITSQDTGEGTVSPATLTFTSANWNTNQTVTVTGIDDDIIDGDITYNVTVSVNDGSSNDAYDGVADSQASVTNNDNDGASLVVSAISNVTTEAGTTATFTVKLGKGPLTDVVLNVTSNDLTEGTVSPATLTFTSLNWNTNQTVTVTGVDDALADGDITYNVTVSVNDGSSNDSFDGVADSQVAVINDDDEVVTTYQNLSNNYGEVNTNPMQDISDDRTLGVYVKAGSVYLWDFTNHTSTLVSKLPNLSTANGLNPRISSDGSTVVYQSTAAIDAADTNALNDIYSYDVATDTNTKITQASTTVINQSSGDGATCGSDYNSYLYCDGASETPGDFSHGHNTSTGIIYTEYTSCAEFAESFQTGSYSVRIDGIVNPIYWVANETIYNLTQIKYYQNPDTNSDGSIIVYEKYLNNAFVDYTYNYGGCATLNTQGTTPYTSIAKFVVATQTETTPYTGSAAVFPPSYGGCNGFVVSDSTSLEKPSISPNGSYIAYYKNAIDEMDQADCTIDRGIQITQSINGSDYFQIAIVHTYTGLTGNSAWGRLDFLMPIAMDDTRIVFGAVTYQQTSDYIISFLYCDADTYEAQSSHAHVVPGGGTFYSEYSDCQGFGEGQNTGVYNTQDSGSHYIYTPITETYVTRLRSLKHNGTSFTSSSTLDFAKGFNIARVDLNPVSDEIVFQSPVDNTNVTDTNIVADVYRAKLNMTGLEVLSKHSDGVTQSNAASGATVFFNDDGTAVDFTTSASNLDVTNSSPPMLTRKQIDPL